MRAAGGKKAAPVRAAAAAAAAAVAAAPVVYTQDAAAGDSRAPARWCDYGGPPYFKPVAGEARSPAWVERADSDTRERLERALKQRLVFVSRDIEGDFERGAFEVRRGAGLARRTQRAAGVPRRRASRVLRSPASPPRAA